MNSSRAIVLIILSAFAALASAQTPSSFRSMFPKTEERPVTDEQGQKILDSKGEVKTETVSADSPWAGAQIGFKFGNSGDFSDSVLVAAHLMYDVKVDAKDKFHLPVMGNIADLTTSSTGTSGTADDIKKKAEDLVLSATGARVGLYPYVNLVTGDFFTLLGDGELAWKMNGFKDDAGNVTYLQQGRTSLGAEFRIGLNDEDHLPISLGISTVRSIFSASDYKKVFGTSRNHIQTFETTAIVPIGGGAGFLFEYAVGGGTHSVRAGILFAVKRKS
jgi:hypothetical protein